MIRIISKIVTLSIFWIKFCVEMKKFTQDVKLTDVIDMGLSIGVTKLSYTSLRGYCFFESSVRDPIREVK